MRKSRLFFALLFFAWAGVMGQWAYAAEKSPTSGEKAPAPNRTLDSLESHFQNAKKYFEDKDYGKAASEIRDRAKIIKQEAAQSAGEAKKALSSTVEELEALAQRDQKGAVKTGA